MPNTNRRTGRTRGRGNAAVILQTDGGMRCARCGHQQVKVIKPAPLWIFGILFLVFSCCGPLAPYRLGSTSAKLGEKYYIPPVRDEFLMVILCCFTLFAGLGPFVSLVTFVYWVAVGRHKQVRYRCKHCKLEVTDLTFHAIEDENGADNGNGTDDVPATIPVTIEVEADVAEADEVGGIDEVIPPEEGAEAVRDLEDLALVEDLVRRLFDEQEEEEGSEEPDFLAELQETAAEGLRAFEGEEPDGLEGEEGPVLDLDPDGWTIVEDPPEDAPEETP